MQFYAFHENMAQEVLSVQGRLVQLGYVLTVSGQYDSQTSRAVRAFRAKMGLPPVDRIDTALVTALEMQGRPGYQFSGFGDNLPGESSYDVELAQRALVTIGFKLSITGVYDAPTSAAVLEFRGAAGLPNVNRIDDAFLSRLYEEVDRVGDTSKLPGGGLTTGGRTDEISVTGKIGGGLFGLGVLLAIGYFISRER